MRVCDILKEEREFPVISFEFFPPRRREDEGAFWGTVETLSRWKPDFVSVTYGAGGSTHDKSLEIAASLKERGYNVVAHLTCISSTRRRIVEALEFLREKGIGNVLALRGDVPSDPDFVPPKDGFRYAYQLVEFISSRYDFCVGVAGYPEGHPEAPSLEKDVEYLKLKLDRGAEFVITQLFFRNEFYYRFVELARKRGIDAPIVPGILPITSYNQIVRFTQLCGASIPDELMETVERFRDDQEGLRRAGIEYTIRQCEDLLENGVRFLHFYTLNRSPATHEILSALSIRRP